MVRAIRAAVLSVVRLECRYLRESLEAAGELAPELH